ncbi:unnamed protein product, partial [Closterium sp. NIES-53]
SEVTEFPVLLLTHCLPPPSIFHCRHLVASVAASWLFAIPPPVMRARLRNAPVGTCQLYPSPPRLSPATTTERQAGTEKQAWATVLHSSDKYICGALALARSLRRVGTRHELVAFVSKEVSQRAQRSLTLAGWKVVAIGRMRSSFKASSNYCKYNHSKLRLWQMAQYSKLIFLDTDMLLLRNLDHLFAMPELTAVSNNKFQFNGGLLVVEPSPCTFAMLKDALALFETYGDCEQGLLNELNPWWHRLPQSTNFLKFAWSSNPKHLAERRATLSAQPPVVDMVHYLGAKPWYCYRDFDCNLLSTERQFADDLAFEMWWKVHDEMSEEEQQQCWMPTWTKAALRAAMEKMRLLKEDPRLWNPTALGPAPDDAATARFARQRADRTAWTSRDAAACIALSSLLPESEEVHFTQVRTAAAYLTAIKARYSTPATVSLGRLFLPFLFPDLASFERSADLIAHLRSLDASYRAASTEAQLALLPPPMAITVYFIATSLPDRLASVRDALLLKHPSELTIEVLESTLKDVESNLRSVAAASGTVSPPLFHGCTVPQLPTFTASLATATTDATAAAVTTTSRSRGRGGKKGGSGGGGGGGSGGSGGAVATGGGGSAASGETPRAAAGDSTAPAGGGDPRARQSPPVLPAPLGGAAAWYQAQRQQHLQQQQQPLSSQQPQRQQRQQLAPGSGLRQPQRGAAYPPCPYQVQTGPRRGHPCGRFHPPGQCFAQLTDTVRLTYGVGGPAPDWLPLVQRYGSALWGMSAEQLVDLISAPHALYAVVDSSISDSVYSGVVSLGASLAQLPVASVGTCVDSRPATTSEDASLSFDLRCVHGCDRCPLTRSDRGSDCCGLICLSLYDLSCCRMFRTPRD